MKHTDFYKLTKEIKLQEQSELKAALKHLGGSYEWDINDEDVEHPIIAVNVDGTHPNPTDVEIYKVQVVNDTLEIKGVEKEWGGEIEFEPNDVFAGHLSYIIDYLPGDEDVSQVFDTRVLFGEDACAAFECGEFDEYKKTEGYGYEERQFNTEAARDAYLLGLYDMEGWNRCHVLNDNEQLTTRIDYGNKEI